MVDVLFTAEDNEDYVDTAIKHDNNFSFFVHYLATCLKPTSEQIRALVEADPDCVGSQELNDRGWSILNLASFNVQIPVDAYKFLIDSGANKDIGLCNFQQLFEYHKHAGPYLMYLFPKIMILVDFGLETESLSDELKQIIIVARSFQD